MATAELIRRGGDQPRAAASPAAARADRVPLAVGVALLILSTYAVFAHGAIQAPAEPRLQIAVALVACGAAASGLWMGSLRLTAAPGGILGLLLLLGFAVWSGVSLAWSVAPDLTWLEFNRVVTYALVLALAIALGASTRRALELTAIGFLGLCLLATLYALGQKVLPGIHLAGLVNLDKTGRIARLQEPLGYWNALALLLAMASPVALAVAARVDLAHRWRIGAAIVLELLFVTIGYTYSRGGLVALAAGLITLIALSGSSLRVAIWLGAAALAALPSLVLGLTSHALTANAVALSSRETAGALLLALIVAASVLLWLGAERLLEVEHRLVPGPVSRRRAVKGILIGGGACVLLALIAGLTGTFSHLWSSFTTTHGVSVSNPSRLLSADSANRWVWWKEAAGAFSDRPLAGWGAGSFPVVHLLYRHDTLTVQHPHSVPIQWLAETGIVGFLIMAGAWALLLRAGLKSLRRISRTRLQLVAAALIAVPVAYTVHALYDWDWDMPGITIPVLIVLGVLAGAGRAGGRHGLRAPAAGTFPRATGRLLAVTAATLAMCVFALSVVMPNLAASRASAALVGAAGATESSLLRAQQDAVAATRLDPVSDAGLRVEATIAEHRGDPQLARAYLLEAVQRQPSDAEAWASLALLDVRLGHFAAGIEAGRNVLALDPFDASLWTLAIRVLQAAKLAETPPASSATAIATP